MLSRIMQAAIDPWPINMVPCASSFSLGFIRIYDFIRKYQQETDCRTRFGLFVSCLDLLKWTVCLSLSHKKEVRRSAVSLELLQTECAFAISAFNQTKTSTSIGNFLGSLLKQRGVFFHVFCGSFALNSSHSHVQPTFLQQLESEKYLEKPKTN